MAAGEVGLSDAHDRADPASVKRRRAQPRPAKLGFVTAALQTRP